MSQWTIHILTLMMNIISMSTRRKIRRANRTRIGTGMVGWGTLIGTYLTCIIGTGISSGGYPF
jgi:hypothetical protein